MIGLTLAVILAVGMLAHPAVAFVRTPGDSSIVMQHGFQSPPPAASTSGQPGIRGVPGEQRAHELPPACWLPLRVDPGDRPVWVPATRCWTGFESVWVSGHWQW